MQESLTWQKRFAAEAAAAQKKKESEGSSDPLLFYGLQQHIIPRDDYFDWAMKHYRLPFLDTEFFLQCHPLPPPDWSQNSLKEWSPWFAPVWFYENLVYIGCLEPCEKSFPFPFRFVLTSDQSLKMLWNNSRQKQEATGSARTNRDKEAPALKLTTAKESAEAAPAKTSAGGPNLGGPNLGGPHRGGAASNPSISGEATAEEDLEKTGAGDAEKTFIWRRTESDKRMTSCANLLKETQQWFSGIVIFKREGDCLTPVQSAGRVNIMNPDWKVDLKRKSFFNIIEKDQPYHGFIVKTEINKEIAEKTGWPILPRHVSVIPLPCSASGDPEGGESVFFGVSAKPVEMSEIERLTERVEGFFSNRQTGGPPQIKKAS